MAGAPLRAIRRQFVTDRLLHGRSPVKPVNPKNFRDDPYFRVGARIFGSSLQHPSLGHPKLRRGLPRHRADFDPGQTPGHRRHRGHRREIRQFPVFDSDLRIYCGQM